MKKLFFMFVASMLFFACNNTPKADATTTKDNKRIEGMPADRVLEFDEPIDFELTCVEQAEPAKETGQAYYKLYLKTALVKEPIFIEKLFGCAPVATEEYRALQMLSNTNSAVNGWYAGGGPLIYGYIEDNNEIVLMKAFQEEGDSHEGHDHEGHDHAGHGHEGHDHVKEIDYKEFMRFIVHKDGSFENKTR
ncbi:MAG: hypothetical protein AB8G15_21670 [Saprospiraceae bacterium]